jgi:filamentous hemagglutinin family protein
MSDETTRRHSGMDASSRLISRRPMGRRLQRFALRTTSAITSAAVAASSLLPGVAWALPQGGTVVEGDATIAYGEDSVTITQGSSHVIIEWDSFDIGANESVHFDQAAFMAALNRVLSGEASQILGSLTGAGSITIVNQAGIAFGAGANVDVGAITATTLDILNANFMADNLVFDQYDPAFATASVTNAGTITVADQGLAMLVGPGVANNGLIQARTGAVVLASGTAMTVDFYGDGLINFAVTGATEAAPVDASGKPLDALVSNTGQIYADGGTVILAAEAVGGIVDNAINMSGVIQARTVEGRNGQIALVAGDGAGAVQVAGTLDASGADAGETGGTVHVLGDGVALNAGADVNVSAAAGGGEALIGGAAHGGGNAGSALQYSRSDSVTSIIADPSFQAGGYIRNSGVTYLAEGSSVNANATAAGDGGSVVVWSDQQTTFHGTITARGGTGGSGGQIEVSGTALALGGSATVGAGGRVLFDPVSLTINTAEAASIVASLAGGGTVDVAAEQLIDVRADIDSSAQANAATLNFLDQGGAAGLQVDLNAQIILGANQQLTGDATLVNVTSVGLIQNGVDVATAAGATVNVADGTFTGGVVVDKANLTLFGTTAATVVPSSPGFIISASGVTIDGFSVSGTGGDPAILLTGGADEVIIRNGFITGTAGLGAGIRVDNTVTTALDLEVSNMVINDVGGHGIVVDGALAGAVVTVFGSQIDAGNTALGNGDGVHFSGPIADSTITVGRPVAGEGNLITVGGNNGAANNTLHDGVYFGGAITGTSDVLVANNTINVLAAGAGSGVSRGDMGVRFDGFVNLAAGGEVRVDGNAITGGLGREDRGISFWNGIAGSSSVVIADNTISAGDDGIGLFDVENFGIGDGAGANTALRGNAVVQITGNDIGTAVTTVGLASVNDGNGIDSQAVAGASLAVISGNAIYADDNGIEFDRVVTSSVGVQIVDNSVILSRNEHGIAFEDTLTGTSVLISGNDLIQGDLEGIHFASAVGTSTVTIADNLIFALNGDGIGFDGTLNNSSVTIGGPTVAEGNVITGEDDGIETVAINGGSFTVAHNAQVTATGNDAIAFDGAISGAANVSIDGNQSIIGDDVGINFGASIAGATISITDNQGILTLRDHGILFAGAVTGSTVDISGNLVSATHPVFGVGDGVHLAGAIDSSTLTFDANDIQGVGDGIDFAGAIGNASSIVISNNTAIGSSASGLNLQPTDPERDGIVFRGPISDAATQIEITGNSQIGGVERGIAFLGTVADASIDIAGNSSVFGDLDAGIAFVGTLDNASVVIGGGDDAAGNTVTGGIDGIRAATIDGGSFTVAHNTSIQGLTGKAISFAGPITGAATVGVTDNHDIIGAQNGVAFLGGIDGASDITVSGNNAGITAGIHGVYVGAPIATATVTVAGNIIDAGNTAGLNGDGVHFAGSITDSTVTVGGATAVDGNDITTGTGSGANNTLHDGVYFGGAIAGTTALRVGANAITVLAGGAASGVSQGDMGVRFDGFVNTSGAVLIDNNTIVGALGKEDRGVSFWNGISGSAQVTISGNVISAGDDGIGLFDVENFGLGDGFGADQAIRTNAVVTIAGNSIGTLATPVGIASLNDGNGIDLQAVIGASQLVIDGNAIYSDDNAVEFDNVVSTTGSVQISNNSVLSSTNENGIAFEDNLSATTVLIEGNAEIRGFLDGIRFVDPIGSSDVTIAANGIIGVTRDGIAFASQATNSTILIGGADDLAGNTIIGADDGISAAALVGGSFAVAHNASITGSTDNGIAFEGPLSGTATVAVTDNHDIIGGTNGIAFLSSIGAGSTVTIAGNNAGIFSGIHGVYFGGPIAASSLTLAGNIIDAGNSAGLNGDGIHFAAAATIDDSTVTIGGPLAADGNDITTGTGSNANGTLHDGIYFGGAITGLTDVDISNNQITVLAGGPTSTITLGDMGIRFDGFVATDVGGSVVIDENVIVGALGKEDRGISFWNGIGGATSVAVTDNTIAAGDDGVGVFDVEDHGLGDGVGQFLALRETAQMQIEGNAIGTLATPVGLASIDDGNGIDFEGVAGAASLTIAGNSVFADDNGIEFDKVVTTTGTIAIVDNAAIRSFNEHGIAFEGGVSNALVDISGNGDIQGGLSGIRFFQSITNATIVIDSNGSATLGGLAYDGTGPVDLDDLVVTGSISGGSGTSVSFGTITGTSSVTVSRNFITEGANGVGFGTIQSTQVTAVYNNFILDALNDGITFTGRIGSGVEVYQNFLADNGGDGIGIASEVVVEPGDLRIRLNFMPGAAFDHGNGGFGFNNQGNGTADIGYNWWGSPFLVDVATAINGQAVPSIVLFAGADNNVVPPAALADTGLDPFAFQQSLFGASIPVGTIITDTVEFLAPALLLFIAGQTNPDQAPGDQIAGRTGSDSENVFDNPFADPYAFLVANDDLANLAPAAGGQGCAIVAVPGGVRLSCGGGSGGFSGLAPAAGGGQAGAPGAPSPIPGGPALDPGLSLQDMLNMWLYNYGTGLDTEPVADDTGQPAAALDTLALQLASLR